MRNDTTQPRTTIPDESYEEQELTYKVKCVNPSDHDRHMSLGSDHISTLSLRYLAD